MSKKREPGYYWVRIGAIWFVGLWGQNEWIIDNVIVSDTDEVFNEIGNRITPEMKYTEEDMIDFGKHAMISDGLCSIRVWSMENFINRSKVFFINWVEQRKEKI